MYTPFLKAFSDEVQKRDGHPILLQISDGIGVEKGLPRSLTEKRLDGFLLTGLLTRRELDLFGSFRKPFIVWGCYDAGPEINLVKPDVMEETIRQMNYLFSLGHEKIGVISELLCYAYHQEILQGYREAYRRRGLSFREEWIQQSGEPNEGGYRPTEVVLNLPDVPSALLVTDYGVACGAVQTLHKHGLVAGQDMSVVTFSAIANSPFKPRLTQSLVDMDAAARLMIRMLFDRIAEPEQPALKTLVPYIFDKGETCGPMNTKREAP